MELPAASPPTDPPLAGQASPAGVAAAAAPGVPTLLCVDDEPNILSALRRLFRTQGYRVLTAGSGAEGLALLETEHVDLVMSDMRMPEMDGATFLEHVRARRPDAVRLLLTGYSDVSLILAAINRGEIYRYITKPWDDNDILLQVRHALERRALEQLAQRQTLELKALNTGLEAKVAERTAELTLLHDEVVQAHDELKANFITTIKILSSMIEMRGGHLAGHARRVADLARRIAVKMGLDNKTTQEVFIAALLHEIGKIGFSDALLAMPVSQMAGDALHAFRKHPVRAEQLLMPLGELRGAATIVRSHMERHDGAGFPDALAGDAIPLGARIIGLASDYDNLQLGAMVARRVAAPDAKQLVYDSSGKRYDPLVVAAFRALLDGDPVELPRDVAITSAHLLPGMRLSRDLVSADGLMLLSAEHVCDARIIGQVRDFEDKNGTQLHIWVWPLPVAAPVSVNQVGHAVGVEVIPVAVGDVAVGALDVLGAQAA